MAALDALRVLGRRWYVMVLVLAATVAVGLQLYPGQHTYSARTTVVFVWPGALALYPTEDDGIGALVNFAALVRQGIRADDVDSTASASFGGTLVGAGVGSGHSVVLPNSGGQWSDRYDQPVLNLESVGPTPAAATGDLRELVAQIDATVESLQARLNVPVESRVRISVDAPVVADGGATGATRMRGAAGAGILGIVIALVATLGTDRIVEVAARRRALRSRAELRPQ